MFQESDFPLHKAVPDSLLITQLMSLQYLEAFGIIKKKPNLAKMKKSTQTM